MKIKLGTLRKLIKEALDEMVPTDERDQIASIYSDVFKEKYGVRPRHIHWEEYSVEELSSMLEKLYDEPGYNDDWSEPEPPEPDPMAAMMVSNPEEKDSFEKLPKMASMGQRHYAQTRLHGPNVTKK